MKKKTTTHGLSLEKVVDLLNIGTDVDVGCDDADQDKSDLLNERLNEPLLLYKDKPRKKAGRLSYTIAVLAGEPIGKLLHNPKTDTASVRMTKDLSKRLATRTKSEAEHQAANVIYYAAIAHALVFHNRKITKFSYEDLRQSFGRLSKENWIPEWLLGLLAKACEYCKVKMK